MILISCPYCGPRDESEFAYGGPRRPFPPLNGKSDTNDWFEALYHAPNPRGEVVELWYHASGCETWIEVTRDTATHEITRCTPPQQQPEADT